MDADGSNQTRLTEGAGNNGFPAWSPGGSRIASRSDRDGGAGIYVMDANGVFSLSWSPDSKLIVYARLGLGLHVMNADGSNQRALFPDRRMSGNAPPGRQCRRLSTAQYRA